MLRLASICVARNRAADNTVMSAKSSALTERS